MDLAGIFPPVTTPFRDHEVDLAALRDNLERYLACGVRGVVVLGSNGEAPLLDEDEAERIVAAARAVTPPERLLVAGAGRQSTRATIAATRRAAAAGADAVLVGTPSYYRRQMTEDVLVQHYAAVADASPVPVLLYNFAAQTGVDLPLGAVIRLADHPNVAGMKESSGDVVQLADEVAQTPARFRVLVGAAPSFYASLCVGAAGAVTALACVVPELCVRLHAWFGEGRHSEALALQRALTPLARSVTTRHGVPGLKAALELCGYRGGEPRPPLAPAPAAAVEEIRRQLAQLQVEYGDRHRVPTS